MAFLADDSLEGRATGTRGYELAARYVADRMAALGLEAAGVTGWFQPVALLQSTANVTQAKVVLAKHGTQTELRPAIDFVPLPAYFSTTAVSEAPLVFAGFGISAPEFGHDDFVDIDLTGKIAVVLDGVPRALPPELRDYFAKQKTRQIAEKGAVGLVYLTAPGQTPWEQTVLMAGAGKYRLVDAEGQPHDADPATDASITLAPSVAASLFEGAPKSLERILEDAQSRSVQSFDLAASISIATGSVHRTVRSFNVVGVLPGSSPRLRRDHVVVMAHLDHIGKGVAVDGDDIYNGALDNASGVAVMLEAARILADATPRPRRSILFLATTAEEHGLLGAWHFATNPTVSAESLVAALNLDMPVALYPPAGFTAVGAEYSTLGAVADRALQAEGMRSVPSLHPERGLFTYTDQYSFVREGIPALYIHDAPLSSDPAIDAQAIFDDFLQQHYHQVTDDTDLPIHWRSLAKLARIHALVCLDVANARARPQWLASSFFKTVE